MLAIEVENNIVVNLARFEDGSTLTGNWSEAINGEQIGWVDNGFGVFSAPVDDSIPSDDELRTNKMMTGVEFDGVMCSCMKDDMYGLASIKSWLEAGNSIGFKFKNGNTLNLDAANIVAFEETWVPFRASFF